MERPTRCNAPSVEKFSAVKSFPVNHLRALRRFWFDVAPEVVERRTAFAPMRHAIGEAYHAGRIGRHDGASRRGLFLQRGECGHADIHFVTIGAGQFSAGGLTEFLAGFESRFLRLMK